MRPSDLPPLSKLAENKPHSTRIRYMAGCRCLQCKAANSAYAAKRATEIKKGNWNGLVPAKKARQHILKLSKASVGRHSVADAAGVPFSTIARIRSGEKKQIRAETEKKILSVTKDALANNAIVDAYRTTRLLQRLLETHGFTKAQLALRLGYKTPQLQIYGKKQITAKTAMRVEKFYNSLMFGGECPKHYPKECFCH